MSQICAMWFNRFQQVSLTIRKHLHSRLTYSILTRLLLKALFYPFCLMVNFPFFGFVCGIWLRAYIFWMPTYPKSPFALIFRWIFRGLSWKMRISDLRPSSSTRQCSIVLFFWLIISCDLIIWVFLEPLWYTSWFFFGRSMGCTVISTTTVFTWAYFNFSGFLSPITSARMGRILWKILWQSLSEIPYENPRLKKVGYCRRYSNVSSSWFATLNSASIPRLESGFSRKYWSTRFCTFTSTVAVEQNQSQKAVCKGLG